MRTGCVPERVPAELTLLEWFHALAPPGLEIPEAVVNAHEAEALALGRTDLSVKRLAPVDVTPAGAPPASVEKINLCAGGQTGVRAFPANVTACTSMFSCGSEVTESGH